MAKEHTQWQALYRPVWEEVQALLLAGRHVLVGIDGMSASGKTHLAAHLAERAGGRVVHADDFFLRPPQRTPQRLAETGGNIDYERLAPVLAAAGAGETFDYLKFDCQTGALLPQSLPAAPLTVVEGAYAMHPKLGAAYHLRIFMRVSAQCQLQRIHRRSPQQERRFLQEWIPMEHRYFQAFQIPQSCRFLLDTSHT